MNENSKLADLAVNGGSKVREEFFPPRPLFGEEEKQAAIRVFDEVIETDAAFCYNGKYEQAYEKKFCEFMGGGYADGVNSGTNAVFVALGALDLEPLSEVIVPAITDAGGVMPVPMLNCVPVFADCAPGSYNIGAAEIDAVLTERTKAVIVAHIGGDPADMDDILKLTRKYGIPVIEDCSQAHGALYKGKKVGSIGDIAAFSTMSSKHHASGGQGGLVYTSDQNLYWEAKRFADRGKAFGLEQEGSANSNVRMGLNCNLNDLSAAIGCVQLDKLPGILQRRREIGNKVRQALAGEKAVFMGALPEDSESSYWFLRIGINPGLLNADLNVFINALGAEGIPCGTYRHCPAEAPWFKERNTYGKSGYPWTDPGYKGNPNPVFELKNMVSATNNNFNININENYSEKDVDDIIKAIIKVERAYLKQE